MKTETGVCGKSYDLRGRLIELFLITVWFSSGAHAFPADQQGAAVSRGFCWQFEEDGTHRSTPGIIGARSNSPLSLSFHTSHHSAVVHGEVTGAGGSINLQGTNTQYFLLILPFVECTLDYPLVSAGRAFEDPIKVAVSRTPMQISVILSEEYSPMNSAQDFLLEQGIIETFESFRVPVEGAGRGYEVSVADF